MKEIEDRGREDAYRRQELDAKLMGAYTTPKMSVLYTARFVIKLIVGQGCYASRICDRKWGAGVFNH